MRPLHASLSAAERLPHQILAAIEMLTALATEPNVHLGLLDLSANTFATYADGAHAP